MTRQLLVLTAIVSLAACIPVEDFGAYWQKTDLDKRLEGSWKRVPASPYQTPDSGYGIGSVSRFVRKGDAYEMIVHDQGKEPRDRPLYPVKTLSVGRYRFLAFGPVKGMIHMYRVRGRTLEMCGPLGQDVIDWLQKRFPAAVNIKKNTGEGEYLTIARFDDEVFRVLSEIPDDDTHWACEEKFERVP